MWSCPLLSSSQSDRVGRNWAIIIFAVFVVGQFTLGLWLYSGAKPPMPRSGGEPAMPRSGDISLTALLREPLIYAVLVSLFFLITGVKPHEIIAKATGLLGDVTIPMMLFTLGVSLARLKVLRFTRPFLLSMLRFGMGLGTGLLLSALFGLTGTARDVFILQNTMPVAVFNYLLAERYKRNAGETAELLITSTLLSLLTLPLVLHYLK